MKTLRLVSNEIKFSKSAVLVLFIYLFPNVSLSLPYERNCSEGQKERTLKFVSSATEANYCFECIANNLSPHEAIIFYKNLSYYNTIPKECFLSIAVRGNQIFKGRYNYCSDENNVRFLQGREQRFCMNEDYITVIHESFKKMSYCFGFDKSTQEDIFHLINRESGGILNARSETGARCLGQITEVYVKDINDIIKTANWKRPHAEAFIWKELLQRCPDLESAQIKLQTISCQSTQNPEICLLYSFFGKKRSLHNTSKRLNSSFDYMGNREFPMVDKLIPENEALAKTRYQNFLNLLPMKKKEMMAVKATLKNGKKVNWVMWDDLEIYDNNLHKRIDWTQELEIKKIPLFKSERDIKNMFMYWSHNGGGSLSRDSFTLRLRRLKQEIARGGCKKSNQELRCQMRRKMENGEPISNSLAFKYFERDLRRTYPGSDARKLEVSKYIRGIIDSRSIVFDNSNPDNKAMMLNYHKENGIDEETASQFLKETNRICPKILDITD